jgi:hypothetical protein
VQEVGRDIQELPQNTKLIFLDLFLGVKRQDQAREEAAEMIKTLLKNVKDRDRPVVVLMSTETSEQLEGWANELRSKAALLGAKFRVMSKTEFDREEPLLELLEELLAPLEKAQALAGLLDEWDSALERLRSEVMKDLRNLDLSDCAYLQRFRLAAEGMPLGMYLMEAYSDVLKYRFEGCVPLLNAARTVDELNFDEMPPAHFLPNEGVNWLTHAMSFVNEDLIAHRGHQFATASKFLELGDIIIQKPANWKETGDLQLPEGAAVYAVISQACDLQQDKSHTVLLLHGALRARTWNDPIKPYEGRLDCFRFRERDYLIEWEKAKLDAWPKPLADRRLKIGGTHLRIARLRALPALNAQQIFASNLTRVGTLARPHMVVPVGLKVVAKDQGGQTRELFHVSAEERFACFLKGLILVGRSTAETEYLVFKSAFGDRLGEALLKAVEEFHPALRPSVKNFAQSRLALMRFRTPCRIGQKIEHDQLKIDIRKGELPKVPQNLTIIAELPALDSPVTALLHEVKA